MTELNGFPPPGTGRAGRAADTPRDGVPRADVGRREGGGTGGARDPFDLPGAFARLKTLLAFDGGNGPRSGVPSRGFYLNILT